MAGGSLAWHNPSMSVVTVPFAEPRKTLILCADDYALSPGVSLGIRQLAEAGRISATGAMTCMPYWSSEAPALRALVDRVQVGLHFTLTDQRPLGPMPHLAADGRFPSVGRLLKRSLLGGMPSAEVAAELERQLDAFEAAFVLQHPCDVVLNRFVAVEVGLLLTVRVLERRNVLRIDLPLLRLGLSNRSLDRGSGGCGLGWLLWFEVLLTHPVLLGRDALTCGDRSLSGLSS